MHILPKGYTRSRSYGGYHGLETTRLLRTLSRAAGDHDRRRPPHLVATPPSHRNLRRRPVFVAKSPWCASSSSLAQAGGESSNETSTPIPRSTPPCTTSTFEPQLPTRSTTMDSHCRVERHSPQRPHNQRDRFDSLQAIRAQSSDSVDDAQRLDESHGQTSTIVPHRESNWQAAWHWSSQVGKLTG